VRCELKRTAFLLLASAALLAQPAAAVAQSKPRAAPRAKQIRMIRPQPRPPHVADAPPEQPPEQPIDLSRAVPARNLARLPSSAEQLQALNSKLKEQTPQVEQARRKSDALSAEAAALRKKLIATAAEIGRLEREREEQDERIAQLAAEDERLSAGFAKDRVAVTRLLAVLQRLQHDMPPALALKSGDGLSAARGSMLIGASLPPLYARAAALSRRLDALAATRAELADKRQRAEVTEKSLGAARGELALLLAAKEREAEDAAGTYGTLQRQLAVIAAQAADFRALLERIARLRRAGSDNGVVVVESRAGKPDLPISPHLPISKGSLRTPVVGTLLPPGTGSGPGSTFATLPGAQVIAPADGKVLFAGPYHKSGQVLILEIGSGYDLVLAGLGQVTVRPNDELLAGEPVGTMPGSTGDGKLYFELRRDGKGLDPAPWLSLDLRKAKKT
jgi:septal ring factor EnvC (AmiA/AmiB activator)